MSSIDNIARNSLTTFMPPKRDQTTIAMVEIHGTWNNNPRTLTGSNNFTLLYSTLIRGVRIVNLTYYDGGFPIVVA